jgi:hypothetical protein
MSSATLINTVAEQLDALSECIHMVQTFGSETSLGTGPHGRVLRDAEHVLKAIKAKAAIVGGLAVIHHGYERYTHDVDLVIAADAVPEFLRIAPVRGFRIAKKDRYGWHKFVHKETGMDLHLVPPGKPSRRAPSEIPGPAELGVRSGTLGFPTLPRLLELKLLAGRLKDQADVVGQHEERDQADVVELLKCNWSERTRIRDHLARVAPRLVAEFDRLVAQAASESETDRHR